VRGHWAADFTSLTDSCGTDQYCREFTGYDTEPISGLEYAVARVYDPALGMFLTQDPVREYANLYAYVAWNPINRTDPTGTDWSDSVTLSKGFGTSSFSFYGSADITAEQLANLNFAQIVGQIVGGGLGETGGPQGPGRGGNTNNPSQSGPGGGPPSAVVRDATDWANQYNPVSVREDTEIGTILYRDNGVIGETSPVFQTCTSGQTCTMNMHQALSEVPKSATELWGVHAHGAAPLSSPNDFIGFSTKDVRFTNTVDVRMQGTFLANPQSQLRFIASGVVPMTKLYDVNFIENVTQTLGPVLR
jgi:RHS repeat-associated protein